MKQNLDTDLTEAKIYQIKVQGYLCSHWADWFQQWRITHEENGDTILTGVVFDQAALFGLLRKIRDLGMPLLAVVCAETRNTAVNQQEITLMQKETENEKI